MTARAHSCALSSRSRAGFCYFSLLLLLVLPEPIIARRIPDRAAKNEAVQPVDVSMAADAAESSAAEPAENAESDAALEDERAATDDAAPPPAPSGGGWKQWAATAALALLVAGTLKRARSRTATRA